MRKSCLKCIQAALFYASESCLVSQGVAGLFVRMVAGAYHGADGGVGKAELVSFLFEDFELVGRHIAQDGQVAV